jgi:hypothetical protein
MNARPPRNSNPPDDGSGSSGSGPARSRARDATVLSMAFLLLVGLYAVIYSPALATIETALKRQSGSFLLVSTLKSSLSMVEGSDVGFGFRMEVGDAVQSLYDLVDFTWKTLLYGILLITFSKIFIDSNLNHIGVVILACGFAATIIGLFAHRHRQWVRTIGSGAIVAGLIVSFYVPVSTLVSFRTCEYFVSHIERDLNQQMEAVLEDWEHFKRDFSPNDLKASLDAAVTYVKELFLRLTQVLITYTCLMLIRYLLFPLIVAYGFFLIGKAFLKSRFGG